MATPQLELENCLRVLARIARIMEQTTTLPLAHYRLLALVASGEQVSSRIAARLPVSKPTVTATVDTLAAQGLLARERHESDGRSTRLRLTSAGRAILAQTNHELADRLGPAISQVSEPDLLVSQLVELGEVIERELVTPGQSQAPDK
jgi:DNA-binding MarR family transcriptional regulator